MNTDQTYDEDLENELNELLEDNSANSQNLNPKMAVPPQQNMQPVARPQQQIARPPQNVAIQEQGTEPPQIPTVPNKQLIVEM